VLGTREVKPGLPLSPAELATNSGRRAGSVVRSLLRQPIF